MTQKKYYRIAQVNRLLKDEIASLLLMELEDDRLKQLTVTEVRTSKDLSHAVVFVTTGGEEYRKLCMEAAQRSAGYIRKQLYSRLRLKHIPFLEFRYDESLDRAERIFEKLEHIQTEVDDDNF